MGKKLKWLFTILMVIFVSAYIAGCSKSSSNAENKSDSSKTEEAATLPNGDVNFLIPVAAGGGTDLTWRTLSQEVEKILDKNVVVVNKPGAGGSIGFGEAANYEPNGLNVHSYTSEIFTLPILQETSFSPDDFKPVLLANFDPASIVVPADSPFKTIEEFVAAAKKNPGKISLGNSGFGNIWHLSAFAFEESAGVSFNHVPFEGSAPTVNAAMGGHIQAFISSPPEVSSQVTAGKLRILAVMSDERLDKFPDVPTLKEKDIDVSIGTWRGFGVPKDTPDEAVKILQDAYAEAMKTDTFINFMNERGQGIQYMNTENFTKFVEEQRPIFEELAKKVKASQ
ncbi:tripartite tricarboxylate transporter substrate binding protein [Neobacillus sp. 3P2-tot-E-2]|uniref:tripartite tricarboxylate transporter substrate binding protein n=1 Tax=Neobacillus sp. 3P2-tot-E-2 TaxID=3132212 RepID=UPI0039A3695F